MSEQIIYLPIWVVALLGIGAQMLGYLFAQIILRIFE